MSEQLIKNNYPDKSKNFSPCFYNIIIAVINLNINNNKYRYLKFMID